MVTELRLTPPQKTTVVELIIDQIVSQVHDAKLRPGDKLPSERELMDMLGVGRSSVREALKGLAAMGVVEIRPGEGTFVKELEPAENLLEQDIAQLSKGLQKKMRHHLNQARHLVEEGIAELACEQLTESDARAILQALDFYEAHRDDESEEAGAWPGHDELHLALAAATGNPILVRVLKTLLELVPMTLRAKGFQHQSPQQSAERRKTESTIHRCLCQAVLNRDAAAAREWIARHAEHEERIINEFYGT